MTQPPAGHRTHTLSLSLSLCVCVCVCVASLLFYRPYSLPRCLSLSISLCRPLAFSVAPSLSICSLVFQARWGVCGLSWDPRCNPPHGTCPLDVSVVPDAVTDAATWCLGVHIRMVCVCVGGVRGCVWVWAACAGVCVCGRRARVCVGVGVVRGCVRTHTHTHTQMFGVCWRSCISHSTHPTRFLYALIPPPPVLCRQWRWQQRLRLP